MDSLEAPLEELEKDLTGLKATILDAQSAKIQPETLKVVVELAVLRTHSSLEWFIQEAFFQAMLGADGSEGSFLTLNTRSEAELVLLSSGSRMNEFVTWLPLNRTKDMAVRFLRPGHRFGRLFHRPVEKRAVAELAIVRNAVAHPGENAHQKFLELAKRREYQVEDAADYLLRKRSGTEEILLLIARSQNIAKGLSAASEHDASQFLEPEDPFDGSDSAPGGWYKCLRCESRTEQEGIGKLGSCSECPQPIKCPSCNHKTRTPTKWQRVTAI